MFDGGGGVRDECEVGEEVTDAIVTDDGLAASAAEGVVTDCVSGEWDVALGAACSTIVRDDRETEAEAEAGDELGRAQHRTVSRIDRLHPTVLGIDVAEVDEAFVANEGGTAEAAKAVDDEAHLLAFES